MEKDIQYGILIEKHYKFFFTERNKRKRMVIDIAFKTRIAFSQCDEKTTDEVFLKSAICKLLEN